MIAYSGGVLGYDDFAILRELGCSIPQTKADGQCDIMLSHERSSRRYRRIVYQTRLSVGTSSLRGWKSRIFWRIFNWQKIRGLM
jgi:hypothetical protein